MKQTPTRIDRLAKIGLLSSLALVLSYLETMVPLPVALPGVKLGLANVAVVVALFTLDWKSAAAVAATKVMASGLLFGSPVMLAYSLGGMALAFSGMLALRAIPGVGAVAVSMVAAVLHNAGQLAVAAIMLKTPAVMINLAPLSVAALVTGLLTGVVAAQAIGSVSPHRRPNAMPAFAQRFVANLLYGQKEDPRVLDRNCGCGTRMAWRGGKAPCTKAKHGGACGRNAYAPQKTNGCASRGAFSFGVYRPGESFMHGLDPRAKIILALFYMIASFAASGAFGMLLILACAIAAPMLSGLSLREAHRALKPFAWLIAFILAFDSLFVNSGDILFAWGIVCVSSGGVAFAFESCVRFACMLLATSTLMATTSPTALTDAFAFLLAPLRHIGVRVDDAALVMGITLRFIPTFSSELFRIKNAQVARCARFESGSWVARVARLATLSTPLLASALRRSSTLALSIASRAYGSRRARTCARIYRMDAKDWGAIAASVVLVVACLSL